MQDELPREKIPELICGISYAFFDMYHPLTLLDETTIHKINRILLDKSHTLFDLYFFKRKSGRLISMQTKTERQRKGFLPRLFEL